MDRPDTLSGADAEDAWLQIPVSANDYLVSNINRNQENNIRDTFMKCCVLYFPSNRFEEPAWLNETNLNSKAVYTDLYHVQGYTNRKIISYAPLHDNQNWLFDVIYDRTAFEIQTQNLNLPFQQDDTSISIPLPLFLGYAGQSTNTYETALEIVRRIINKSQNVRFGIGRRSNRTISIMENDQQVVPNIFQLSSGETALLDLFLSILRDFDLSGASFNSREDIKGIVLVDEIDLHLHVVHQHGILPTLIKMFPNVQFIVTTHSPLFVLGMEREFGSDGFALYRLPGGHQIDPEEFSEFGAAYRVFSDTITFSEDVRNAIRESQKPIVCVDGVTDVKYLHRAAQLLGKSSMMDAVELRAAGGEGQLTKIWNSARGLATDLVPQQVILLHDCDSNVSDAVVGNLIRRVIPQQHESPIEKGIENLFSRPTLVKATQEKPAFIDVTPEHSSTKRGNSITIPELWVVNDDEKTNLSNWLCIHGNADDFANFRVVFDILGGILSGDYG